MRITKAVREHRHHIVLGSRQFTGKVPVRSRFGNSAARMAYALATGKPIQDTQTGLRGYLSDMLDWLCQVPGDRFEYEMNMLLEASSHFRPLADSARIYVPFLKFCTSSGFAAVLDFTLLLLLQWMTANLDDLAARARLVSVIGARLFSSMFNYAMNRKFVFTRGQEAAIRKSLPRYFSLAVVIVPLNYGMLHLLHERIGIPLVAAKLMTEASLFFFSYWTQRNFVY